MLLTPTASTQRSATKRKASKKKVASTDRGAGKAPACAASESNKPQTPEQVRLLELLPLLREAEHTCRSKFQSISGYQITRSTSESISLADSLRECEALEAETAAILDGMPHTDVAELTVPIAQLLDAGSHNFFSGSRRAQGKLVMAAARRALCRRAGGDDGATAAAVIEDTAMDDDFSETASASTSSRTPPQQSSARPSSETDRSNSAASSASSSPEQLAIVKAEALRAEADQLRIENLLSAFANASYLCLCVQLWAPARDGDYSTLSKLLDLEPWTLDEPGRQGQGFTSALQVACAGGNVECVDLLLKHGAIFRDADWQFPTPQPFVCTSMLTGAGYFDQGGAPRGILYFQPSSFPKR